MRIGPVHGRPSADRSRATSRAAAGGPTFSHYLGDAATASPPSAPALSGTSAADPLLGLQQVETATDRHARGRVIRRADSVLDRLAALQADLLAGMIPASRLQALTKMLRVQRERVDDPQLNTLIDEIELRAEVELAKLGHGS